MECEVRGVRGTCGVGCGPRRGSVAADGKASLPDRPTAMMDPDDAPAWYWLLLAAGLLALVWLGGLVHHYTGS